ncbi:MAG: tetratricopeptide repeat protein [Asgard group archaeon]|nr:tetratricopeptide repeat protein [Asgard group archaeon]
MNITTVINANQNKITDWAKELIDKKQLTSQTPIQNIAYAITDLIEPLITGYEIDARDADILDDPFYVKKAAPKKADSDDNDLMGFSLFKPKEPMTEEAEKIALTLKKIFDEILGMLDIIHPKKYQQILQNLGLNSYSNVPPIKLNILNIWADKIIGFFKLSKQITLETIIRKEVIFYSALFTDYQVSFIEYKNKDKFPLYIKRKYGNDFAYLDEVEKLRGMFYLTHNALLEKLGRMNEKPIDPNYWFSLVLIYDSINLPNKADEVGDIALSLNPQELDELTIIVTHYLEKRMFARGLKYFKKSGELFLNRKQFTVAARTFENVTRMEPNVKQNWLNLAKAYKGLGDINKAIQAETIAKGLK